MEELHFRAQSLLIIRSASRTQMEFLFALFYQLWEQFRQRPFLSLSCCVKKQLAFLAPEITVYLQEGFNDPSFTISVPQKVGYKNKKHFGCFPLLSFPLLPPYGSASISQEMMDFSMFFEFTALLFPVILIFFFIVHQIIPQMVDVHC